MNALRPRPLALLIVLSSLLASPLTLAAAATPPSAKTTVTIEGDKFFINGMPTYAGRTWKGKKIEGLMMNSRMVQGVFDDLNPETVSRWTYADTGKWDAERNLREFLAANKSHAKIIAKIEREIQPRYWLSIGVWVGIDIDVADNTLS